MDGTSRIANHLNEEEVDGGILLENSTETLGVREVRSML